MPGAVPYTSTVALAKVTLPYALKLAYQGRQNACEQDPLLIKKRLNIDKGKVVLEEINEALA